MSSSDGGHSIYLGVIIAVTGNILISAALNVQKYSHNKNDQQEVAVHYLKRKVWWLGLILMLSGEVGNFLAYGFAPASVVAPLGTVALVSNAVIAPFVLKEKFRTQDLLGIILSIGGAVVVVIFSSSKEPEWTIDQLLDAMSEIKFIVYVCCTLAALITLLVLSPRLGHLFLVIDMLIVGIFGGYTVIATKAISSILRHGVLKMFTYWIFYIMLIVLVSTGVLQVKYLQKALQKFDSTEVIPAQFVMFTTFAIIGGGILYDDFTRMDMFEVLPFLAGIFSTFVGVFFISSGRDKFKEMVEVYDGDLEADQSMTMESPTIPELKPDEPKEGIIDRINKVTNDVTESFVQSLSERRNTLSLAVDTIRRNYKEEKRWRRNGSFINFKGKNRLVELTEPGTPDTQDDIESYDMDDSIVTERNSRP